MLKLNFQLPLLQSLFEYVDFMQFNASLLNKSIPLFQKMYSKHLNGSEYL